MPEEKLIGPVEVVRDEDGYWYRPNIPDFDEDAEAWKAWLDAQGLRSSVGIWIPIWEFIPTGMTMRVIAWVGSLKRRPVMAGSCSEFSTRTMAPMCSGRAAK